MSGKGQKKKSDKLFLMFKLQIALMLLIVAGLAYYFVGGYANKVSEMKDEAHYLVVHSTEDTFRQIETSIVYDDNNQVVSVLKGEKDVYYLDYEDIPSYVTQALISIEDKKFYQHKGVDYKAIARAVYAMIQNGEATQGGSTITQQLARNIFLSNEKTSERKIEEIYIAVELEKKYTKNDILEFYLNNVYFANGYYGIKAAAQGYFDKDVDELNLSEICFLIAIPNSPSTYDPVTNKDNTMTRRDLILQNMLKDGVISQTTYDNAVAERIVLKRHVNQKNNSVETYAYYCATKALMEANGFEIKTEFKNDIERSNYERSYQEAYNSWNQTLFTNGYRIYTSIDMDMQQELQDCIDTELEENTEVNDEGVYDFQGAGVCLDNETGMVKAIVGGRSQEMSGYALNRAYQSFRQPGSSIKPLLVYTPSLERGYTPESIVIDQEIEDGPENANGTYLGEITLEEAVQKSINTVAWQLYEELTPQVGIQYLLDLGFSNIVDDDYGMAACLGGLTNGVSPLEMAKGYLAIENDGYAREPDCITKITDTNGNVIYEAEQQETSIYQENAARMMTSMLQSVITEGTAKAISLGDMPCAGKTGTTNNNKDGWFVGYTAYYTTSIWVGCDMPKQVSGLTGSSYPAHIWEDYMTQIHQDLLPKNFKKPLIINTDRTQVADPDDEVWDEEGLEDGGYEGYMEQEEGEEAETDTEDEEITYEDDGTMTITRTFDGDEVPEGAIPDDATNVVITHNYE